MEQNDIQVLKVRFHSSRVFKFQFYFLRTRFSRFPAIEIENFFLFFPDAERSKK